MISSPLWNTEYIFYLIYAIKIQVLEVFPVLRHVFSSHFCICVMKINNKETIYIFMFNIDRCISSRVGRHWSAGAALLLQEGFILVLWLTIPSWTLPPLWRCCEGGKDLRGFEQLLSELVLVNSFNTILKFHIEFSHSKMMFPQQPLMVGQS